MSNRILVNNPEYMVPKSRYTYLVMLYREATGTFTTENVHFSTIRFSTGDNKVSKNSVQKRSPIHNNYWLYLYSEAVKKAGGS